jgi:uncharacterized protein YecE (DUF72 family)
MLAPADTRALRPPPMIERMTVYVGTSGWQYKHWLGRFYPRKPRTEDDLAYFAARFQTVELNGTFYRLPEADTFADWARRTPDDFVFAMKASRFLTHMKRLKDPGEPVERMMSRAGRLGGKLGPVLLQMPPDFQRDVARFEGAVEAMRSCVRDVRIAVEFRHDSWFVDDVRDVLRRQDVALCIADRGSRLITPAWRTAEWGYMRFHEGRARPAPCYGRTALASRAAMLRVLYGADSDVFVYFNNDPEACALRDAAAFANACVREGLPPTRTVRAHDVRVGRSVAGQAEATLRDDVALYLGRTSGDGIGDGGEVVGREPRVERRVRRAAHQHATEAERRERG